MVDLTNYFKALLAPRKLGMAAAETGASMATNRNPMSPLARAALGAAQFAPGPMAIGSLAAPILQHFSGQGNDMHRGGLRPPMQGPPMPPPQEQGPPMPPQGPPASAAWSQQPMGTINPHPVMQQPIAAPGPSPTAGMGFNPYPGMPAQSNPTAPAVGDPRMTTGGPDLINKMLAYFQNKQAQG